MRRHARDAIGLLVLSGAILGGSLAAAQTVSQSCNAQHPLECRKAIVYWKAKSEHLENAVVWQRRERARDAEQRITDARKGGSWPGYPIATIMVAAHEVGADYLAPQMLRVGRCEAFPRAIQNHGGSPYFGWFQLGGHFLRDPLIELLGWRSGIAQSLVTASWVRVHGWGAWTASGRCHGLS